MFGCGGFLNILRSGASMLSLSAPHTTNITLSNTFAPFGVSLMVNSWVTLKLFRHISSIKQPGQSIFSFLRQSKDATLVTMAASEMFALFGDVCAAASAGVAHVYDLPVADSFGGLLVGSSLLGFCIFLIGSWTKYIVGRSIDTDMQQHIHRIISSSACIQSVNSVKTAWMSPFTFMYKASVQFDGQQIADKLLLSYQSQLQGRGKEALLVPFAQDVDRLMEAQIKSVEAEIRKHYPGARYIDLEPASPDLSRLSDKVTREVESIQRRYTLYDD
eukprot:GILI01038943.1.p1 GENE.GILI01038943.1~~GILI01038943.1.p1  ORF type:complete len:309 (-),score=92.53 GILI01038943.1:54-875(-)